MQAKCFNRQLYYIDIRKVQMATKQKKFTLFCASICCDKSDERQSKKIFARFATTSTQVLEASKSGAKSPWAFLFVISGMCFTGEGLGDFCPRLPLGQQKSGFSIRFEIC